MSSGRKANGIFATISRSVSAENVENTTRSLFRNFEKNMRKEFEDYVVSKLQNTAEITKPKPIVNSASVTRQTHKFPNFECEFFCDFDLLFETDQIFKQNYANDLCRLIASEAKIECILSFESKRFNERIDVSLPNVVVYAECKVIDCKRFRIELFFEEKRDVKIKIFSQNSLSKLHENSRVKVTRHLNSLDRQNAMKESKHESPTMSRCKKVNELRDSVEKLKRYKFGDLGDIRSIECFKKLSQEALSDGDDHPDDFFDLVMKRNSSMKFIVSLAIPFNVVICRSSVVDLFLNSKCPTVYFDATGTIFRQSKCFLHLFILIN